VFLLELRIGRHRYTTPFAVRGRRIGRLLVVLPATTWQVRNPVDGNGDGFSDRLPQDRAVETSRPMAGSGLPPGFTADDVPLLLALDRARLRYDLTTDLALARGETRLPIRSRGILFSAAPRFFVLGLGRQVRAYVRGGGRVAWLGAGGFTGPIRQDGSSLRSVAETPTRNFLGERLRPGPAEGLLTVLGDRIDFFLGVGGAFGPFASLEESADLPGGARLLASAGAEADRASVVVYRHGGGVVARVGVDGFARAARDSPAVTRIMRRLWTLLSR
jgi:hypothetical protein